MPTAVTKPPVPTVATVIVLLLHVPPAVASVSASVPPEQIVTGTGEIAAGVAFTVTTAVEEQVPIE